MTSQIMIVDDSEFELDMLEHIFREADPKVSVTTASGGKEALDRLRKAEKLPQVILLDLRMPGMTGVQVLKELKGDPSLKRIQVCAFSNGDVQRDICECYEHGASFYFKKPTGLSNLRNFAECFLGLWFGYALHCEAT